MIGRACMEPFFESFEMWVPGNYLPHVGIYVEIQCIFRLCFLIQVADMHLASGYGCAIESCNFALFASGAL